MRLLATSLAALVISTVAADAGAQNFARFERVNITEMKAGGKVVGARIKLTLRPDGTAYKGVLIGIGPGEGGPNQNNRVLAADPKAGHLLYQFPAITDFEANTPKQVTLEVKYADAPKLKPGQSIQIISAWGDGKTATHVFGMTRKGFVADKSYQLPGKAAAKRKVKIEDIRRAGKRLARRQANRRPVRKKTQPRPASKSRHRSARR